MYQIRKLIGIILYCNVNMDHVILQLVEIVSFLSRKEMYNRKHCKMHLLSVCFSSLFNKMC